MTTTRPRTEESKEDLVPIAERFNAYDIELYKWASERFEQTIAEQDADFAVEVAALKTAVSGRPVTQNPPAASEITPRAALEDLRQRPGRPARLGVRGREVARSESEPCC